jgi:hypothetical protein
VKAWSLVTTWRLPVVGVDPESVASATFCCDMTLSSMLCGPALMLIRTALIDWFWAPAD